MSTSICPSDVVLIKSHGDENILYKTKQSEMDLNLDALVVRNQHKAPIEMLISCVSQVSNLKCGILKWYFHLRANRADLALPLIWKLIINDVGKKDDGLATFPESKGLTWIIIDPAPAIFTVKPNRHRFHDFSIWQAQHARDGVSVRPLRRSIRQWLCNNNR